MGSIALQIERLASGSVAASEAVLFDHVAYLSGDILYDAGSGSITFNAPGRYLFNWSVVIQSISSGNNLIFSLVSSQSDVLQGNALLRSGEVTGAAIIDIAAAPATVSLLNGGAGNAVYGSVPVKANLVVFMDTPAGIADSSYCFSMAQLANVVEQLITLYPTSTMSVFTTNLNTLTGTPYQLFGSVDGENGATAPQTSEPYSISDC